MHMYNRDMYKYQKFSEYLFQKIKAGGMILFSGILEADENLLKRKVEQLGFAVLNTEHRGEWICLKVQR